MKRSIDTAFWDDTFIMDLPMAGKMLFMYLITNESTNMLGCYEIHMKKIALHTDLSLDEIKEYFSLLSQKGKASYIDGYVIMHNWSKHQKYNDNMRTSAINDFKSLPKFLQENEIVRGLLKEVDAEYYDSLPKIYTISTLGKDQASEINPLQTLCQGLPNPLPWVTKPIDNIELELELELEEELEVEDEDAHARATPSTTDSFSEKFDVKKEIEKNRTAAREFSKTKLRRPVEELADQYMQHEEIVETSCMRMGLDPPTLERWVQAFVYRKKQTGEMEDSWQNFCRHFANWMGKQNLDNDPLNQNYGTSSSNNEKSGGKAVSNWDLLQRELESLHR